jgi:hypothetical protein
MNEDVLIDLGAISEETNGLPGQEYESDIPFRQE